MHFDLNGDGRQWFCGWILRQNKLDRFVLLDRYSRERDRRYFTTGETEPSNFKKSAASGHPWFWCQKSIKGLLDFGFTAIY